MEEKAGERLVIPNTVTRADLLAIVTGMKRLIPYQVEVDYGVASLEFPAYPLTISPGDRMVTTDGRGIHTTAIEFDILWYLAKTPDTIRSRRDIYENVWGVPINGQSAHPVNVHKSNIDRKIREAGIVSPVKSVYGVGFLFRSEPVIE